MSKTVRQVTQREQLEAQARLRAYAKETRALTVTALTRPVLTEMGLNMWPHTYRTTSSDEIARDNWFDYIDRLDDPREQFLRSQQAKLSDATICWLGSARWVGEGMPIYRLGHKQAASLMATSVSADMAEHVRPPFGAFYIELPDLLQITDSANVLRPITGVLVHVVTLTPEGDGAAPGLPAGEYWRWICTTESDLTLWEMNRSVHELIAGTSIPEDDYFGLGWEMTERDNRVRRLISRLIVSLCLDLESDRIWTRKLEPTARAGKKAVKGCPNVTVFRDPTVIEFDARPYVRAFLAGDRKSPDFQQLVTGHWKSQAYGPRHSLRRPIRILPYKRLEHLPEKPST